MYTNRCWSFGTGSNQSKPFHPSVYRWMRKCSRNVHVDTNRWHLQFVQFNQCEHYSMWWSSATRSHCSIEYIEEFAIEWVIVLSTNREILLTKLIPLGVSMFLRLYYSEPYQKDTKSKEYNQRFVSKLKNNYRSHPSLVAVPNKLFYNHEIRSSANPGKKF